MSPRLQSVALSRWDQIWLCVSGSMKYAPPPAPEIAPAVRPRNGTNGAVKELARRVVDGEVVGDSYQQIGAEYGVSGDSLKAAISRERRRRAGISRRDAA